MKEIPTVSVTNEDAVAKTNQQRAAQSREVRAFGYLKHAHFLTRIARLPEEEFNQLCDLAKWVERDEYKQALPAQATPVLLVEARREHQLTRNELVCLCGKLRRFRLSRQGRALRGEG